ncbi:MAG: pilus assembly protein PilM [Gammaproteobacteria bacterium]|nr:pilus assembly protein PilM [Gammaproteobacteria bacterium]
MSFFSKKNTALHGVDISSSSIKLIELSKSGSKFKVENYANRPVPENAVVEKNINELEAVGDVVIKMALVLKTKTKDAAEIQSNANASAASATILGANAAQQTASDITDVNFRRGNDGEGQIVVEMANNSLTGDIDRSGSSLSLEFRNAAIGQGQQARLDVSDFATPVRFIDVYEENGSVMIVADVTGEYEYIAYQSGGEFVIDV